MTNQQEKPVDLECSSSSPTPNIERKQEIRRLTDYINRGASLIQFRKYENACSYLSMALSMSKELINVENEIEEDSCREGRDSSLIYNIDFGKCVLPGHADHVSLKESAPPRQYGVEFSDLRLEEYLYEHPICVSEHNIGDSSRQECVVLSSIAMFNLALAHHLRALTSSERHEPRSKSLLLEKSSRLYGLAYQILMNESIDCGILFMMVIVNNLAQIHKALGHQEVANGYFQHLLSSLVYMTEYGFNDLEAIECFLRSISHLILRSSAAAAA